MGIIGESVKFSSSHFQNLLLYFSNFSYTETILFFLMAKLSRAEFTDKVQDYIKRINQIAEEQGFSVMMAYYIAGDQSTPDDFIIDWRNMALNDNLYAMSRWNQDIMNNFDDDVDEDDFPPFGRPPAKF